MKIEVSNHAPWASKTSELKVEAAGLPAVTVPCPALQPHAKTWVGVTLPGAYKDGKSYDLRVATGLNLQQPTVFEAKTVGLPNT